MAKPVKYSLILIFLGIIASLLLAFVNDITSDIIEERNRQLVKEALQGYFDYDDYSENQSDKFNNLGEVINEVYYGFDANGKVSAVIYKTVDQGYGGPVVSLVSIKADGTFEKAEVIDVSKETSGIGTKVQGYDFQIGGDSVNSYTYEVKSGATVTSNAVVSGIVAAAAHFKTIQNTLGGITK